MEAQALDTTKLVAICRANDAEMVALFGSMARGDASVDSDVDLLVRFSRGKSLLALIRLERVLSTARFVEGPPGGVGTPGSPEEGG